MDAAPCAAWGGGIPEVLVDGGGLRLLTGSTAWGGGGPLTL